MGEHIYFLIFVYYEEGECLLECALKVRRDSLPGDCAKYPMEPENREHLHSLLPLHVSSSGPIVEVKTLFDIHVVN